MGKRKSSAKPQKKIKQVLDTQFSCLFCNHEKSVNCTLDKKVSIGTLKCKVCGQSFQSPINSLSQPIDIYSDWVDACEAVAEEQSAIAKREGDDDDGFVQNDEDEEDDEYQ
ncbi:hypothetical protein CANARDRAFT_29998 [[Candida] arabinofermentans NRRL YB-2248]|uniref:Transcription elongation factor 1 homolog n=1 Tax=[Candida] arabinofermentans NRRL YB-2248 TaxID=983967 RepID=A0A1E4SV27_9ASCO|nr:hypothetical protein CANARDRAFT_29998 [[Candida] arabinofermentans NRRL YB-2248]